MSILVPDDNPRAEIFEELLAALQELVEHPCITSYEDRGPVGYGWQSDEFVAMRSRLTKLLTRARTAKN